MALEQWISDSNLNKADSTANAVEREAGFKSGNPAKCQELNRQLRQASTFIIALNEVYGNAALNFDSTKESFKSGFKFLSTTGQAKNLLAGEVVAKTTDMQIGANTMLKDVFGIINKHSTDISSLKSGKLDRHAIADATQTTDFTNTSWTSLSSFTLPDEALSDSTKYVYQIQITIRRAIGSGNGYVTVSKIVSFAGWNRGATENLTECSVIRYDYDVGDTRTGYFFISGKYSNSKWTLSCKVATYKSDGSSTGETILTENCYIRRIR